MKTKIIDNWEVELINDRGDALTLKGEWYADFFKEYENKQLIIANVMHRFPDNPEIWKWWKEQKFQKEQGEQEYTMIYEIDLPKILKAFTEHLLNGA